MKKNFSHFRQMKITRILLIALIIGVFFVSSASAQLLYSAQTDKETLSTNEVAFLTITIYNDSAQATGETLRIESSKNIIFLENEESIISRTIENINPYEKEVLKIKFKAKDTREKTGTIFAYKVNEQNTETNFAVGVQVKLEDKPIFVKTKAEKRITASGEEIFVEFKLSNNTKESLANVVAQVYAPVGFEVKTAPIFFENIAPEQTIEETFEIMPPLETNGKQKIIIGYGYFDSTGAHYFEKSHDLEFQKDNRLLLGIIGVIILIIAIVVYSQSKKSEPKIKGTGQKK
jgi:hypothetical protein